MLLSYDLYVLCVGLGRGLRKINKRRLKISPLETLFWAFSLFPKPQR